MWDYKAMLKNIREKGVITVTDVLHIIGNLWRHRTTFERSISFMHMLFHGTFCRLCRKYAMAEKCDKNRKHKRLDKLLKNAESRYYKEMDIVNVLNTIRLFKSFFTVMIPTQQRLLLQVQRN